MNFLVLFCPLLLHLTAGFIMPDATTFTFPVPELQTVTSSCKNRCTEQVMTESCSCFNVCDNPLFRAACCSDYESECKAVEKTGEKTGEQTEEQTGENPGEKTGEQAGMETKDKKEKEKKLNYVEANSQHYFASKNYPYDITDETRPPCPDEKFHPMPNDCSKFYRCQDHHGKKIFYIHYFHCAPKTLFSSKLQVCVQPSRLSDKDMEICGPIGPATEDPNTNTDTKVNPTPRPTPPPPTHTEAPKPGPTPPPTDKPVPTIQTDSTTPSAPGTEKSVNPPGTPTPAPTPEITTQCKDCFTTRHFCSERTVCPNNVPETMELCGEAFEECLHCTTSEVLSKEDFCKDGQFYNLKLKKCYDNPNSTSMACDAVEVRFADQYCSRAWEIPKHQLLRSESCHDVSICTSDLRYTGSIELCKHYYVCNQNLELQRVNCAPGEFYNYFHGSCIEEPKANLCSELLPAKFLFHKP